MKVDWVDGTVTLKAVTRQVREEVNHDPFLPLALAAEHSRRLQLGTAIAIALPRSPVQLAHAAWDLHAYSGGRLVLGLGSQVRAHIEHRFGAAWAHPVERMPELILALRAVWAAWADDQPLDFRGRFYQHTLMTPAFSPDPQPHGRPRCSWPRSAGA